MALPCVTVRALLRLRTGFRQSWRVAVRACRNGYNIRQGLRCLEYRYHASSRYLGCGRLCSWRLFRDLDCLNLEPSGIYGSLLKRVAFVGRDSVFAILMHPDYKLPRLRLDSVVLNIQHESRLVGIHPFAIGVGCLNRFPIRQCLHEWDETCGVVFVHIIGLF